MNESIETILRKRPITEYLEKRGILPAKRMLGKFSYYCPLPDHEDKKSPSFIVWTNAEFENFYCFGCLEEHEEIWCENGLLPIGDVKAGDKVWDINGELQEITHKINKRMPTFALSTTSSAEPIVLTADHTCVVIDRHLSLASIPGLYCFGEQWWLRRNRKSKRKGNELKWSTKKAAELVEGDWIGFPVRKDRKNIKIGSENDIRDYTKGPRTERIRFLPANTEAAWLYGMYLAEGSINSYGRVLNFSLNANEGELADKIQKILLNVFSLKSSRWYKNNNLEITCCKVDLCALLGKYFGRGSGNKKIPMPIFSWEKKLQKEVIKGYVDGDGSKDGSRTGSKSRCLSIGIYNLAIQTEMPCRLLSYQVQDGRRFTGVYFRKNQTPRGFFAEVEGTTYYLSRVLSCKSEKKISNVIDITVKNTNTFLTKIGVVHNCQRHWHIIHLVSFMENISFRDAVQKLAVGLDVTFEENLEVSIQLFDKEFCRNDQYPFSPQYDLSIMLWSISSLCRYYLESTNFDVNECTIIDKFWEQLDKDILNANFDDIEETLQHLPLALQKRREKFEQELHAKI